MRERELRENAECIYCGKPFGHTGLPSFWMVTLDHYIIDMRAVQRQTGLAMAIGNAVLASVMGPDEELANKLVGHSVTVCDECFDEHLGPLLELVSVPDETGDGPD